MAPCVRSAYSGGSDSGVAVALGRPQGPLLRQRFLNGRFTRNNSRDSRGQLRPEGSQNEDLSQESILDKE